MNQQLKEAMIFAIEDTLNKIEGIYEHPLYMELKRVEEDSCHNFFINFITSNSEKYQSLDDQTKKGLLLFIFRKCIEHEMLMPFMALIYIFQVKDADIMTILSQALEIMTQDELIITILNNYKHILSSPEINLYSIIMIKGGIDLGPNLNFKDIFSIVFKEVLSNPSYPIYSKVNVLEFLLYKQFPIFDDFKITLNYKSDHKTDEVRNYINDVSINDLAPFTSSIAYTELYNYMIARESYYKDQPEVPAILVNGLMNIYYLHCSQPEFMQYGIVNFSKSLEYELYHSYTEEEIADILPDAINYILYDDWICIMQDLNDAEKY